MHTNDTIQLKPLLCILECNVILLQSLAPNARCFCKQWVQLHGDETNQELMSATSGAKERETALTICCRIILSAKLQIWSKGRV